MWASCSFVSTGHFLFTLVKLRNEKMTCTLVNSVILICQNFQPVPSKGMDIVFWLNSTLVKDKKHVSVDLHHLIICLLLSFCSLVLQKGIYLYNLRKRDRRPLPDCITTLQYHRIYREAITSITMSVITPCLMMMTMMIWISQRLIRHC